MGVYIFPSPLSPPLSIIRAGSDHRENCGFCVTATKYLTVEREFCEFASWGWRHPSESIHDSGCYRYTRGTYRSSRSPTKPVVPHPTTRAVFAKSLSVSNPRSLPDSSPIVRMTLLPCHVQLNHIQKSPIVKYAMGETNIFPFSADEILVRAKSLPDEIG